MVNTARNHAPGPTTADVTTTTAPDRQRPRQARGGRSRAVPERCAAVPGPCSAADRATERSPQPPRPPVRGARRPVRAPTPSAGTLQHPRAPEKQGTSDEQHPHEHRRHHGGAGAGDAVRGGHLAWLPDLRHHPRPAPPAPGKPQRSIEERLAYHSAFVTVRTPAIDTLALTVRRLMLLGRHQRTTARPSLILTGPAATGKTTALLEVGRTCHLAHTRQHPPTPGQQPVVPVAYVLVPQGRAPRP